MDELYKKPLGEILVAREIITQEQLDTALAEQKKTHMKLGEALVSLEYCTEEQITEARALQLGVNYVCIQDYELTPDLAQYVPEPIARTYKVVPVRRVSEKLIIAMVDPLDIEAIDLVQAEAKCHVEAALATPWRVTEAIDSLYGSFSADDMGISVSDAEKDLATDKSDDGESDMQEMERQSRFAPVIRMANAIVTDAVRRKASDIHIEPRRNTVDVRLRLDGDLRLVKSLPKSLHAPLCSRLKVMADLDIAERRLPQDGRITVHVDGRNVDIRVSTNPTLYGERIVLRLLDRAGGLIPLDQLGFSEHDLELFKIIVTQPHGIFLVTGPTGSGKTTTLYAALNMLKSERINIMTVEDPIEYELDGVNQTNVRSKIGLTFANQLRTILRQDPDVVLVGEIRDTETADIAFRSALTGHLVFSTLHCNDAPSGITRLLDMGVEPFLVSSAVIGIQAQRLVRVLCPKCKAPFEADEKVKLMLGLNASAPVTLMRPVGCPECDNNGYKGRTTVSEIMVVNEEISRLALASASARDIRAAAIDAGMVTMREDAVKKVLAGITSADEVQRKILFATDIVAGGDVKAPEQSLMVA